MDQQFKLKHGGHTIFNMKFKDISGLFRTLSDFLQDIRQANIRTFADNFPKTIVFSGQRDLNLRTYDFGKKTP